MEPSAKRRPTEISIHPTLRSMREKITYPALKESEPDVPVGKSGYKIANKNLQKYRCILNGSLFSSKENTFDYYYCAQCDWNYICHFCFTNCHKTHQNDSVKVGETSVNEHPCKCGEKYHQMDIKPNDGMEDVQDLQLDSAQKICCPLDDNLLSLIYDNSENASFIYISKLNHEGIICKACFDLCLSPEEKQNYELLSNKNKDYAPPLHCTCDKSKHDYQKIFVIFRSFVKANFTISGKFNLITDEELRNNPLLSYNVVLKNVLDSKGATLNIGLQCPLKDIMGQFDLFGDLLSELNVIGLSNRDNDTLLQNFDLKIVNNLLNCDHGDATALVDLQLFYLKMCRKLYLKPYYYFFIRDRSNVSPLHRLMFGNFEKKLDEDALLEEIIKNINNKISEGIYNKSKEISKDQLGKLMVELLKYIKILIIISNKKISTKHANFVSEVVQKIKETTYNQKINKYSMKICEMMFAYQNDSYFYQMLFKNTFEEKKSRVEKKEEEDNLHFCFENEDLNKTILNLIFNKSLVSINQDAHTKFVIDNLLNENDFYITSLEQILQYPMLNKMLRKNLKNLIDGDYEAFLANKTDLLDKIHQLRVCFEEKESETINILKTNSFKNIDNLGKMLDSIEEKITACLGEVELINDFQIVFVASFLFKKLIKFASLCNLIGKGHKDQNKVRDLRRKVMLVIELVLDNNPFIASILFNSKMYNIFLYELNEDTVFFYSDLLKIFKKSNYKVNTYSLTFHLVHLSTKTKGIDVVLQTKLLKLFRLILSVTHEKSYAPVHQKIAEELIRINQKEIEGVRGAGGLLSKYNENKAMFNKQRENFLIAYFSCFNKLDNALFQIIKNEIPPDKILLLLTKAKEKLNDFPVMHNLKLRKHLLLFYSKFWFLSLYQWRENDLFNLDMRFMPSQLSDVITDNLCYFPTHLYLYSGLSTKEGIINLISYLKNAITVPVYLVIWKIAYYYLMTIKEKYFIYKVILLYYECMRKGFQVICDSQFREDPDVQRALEKTFCKGFDFFQCHEKINNNTEKILNPSYDCLNSDQCLELLVDCLSEFQFFIDETQKDDKKKNTQNQLRRQNTAGKIEENFNNFIEKYKQTKEENNMLMDLFNDEDAKNLNLEVTDKIISELLNSIIIDKQPLSERSQSRSAQIKFYDYSNIEIINAITKLFKANPRYWQESLLIQSNVKSSSQIVNTLLEYQNFILAQIVLYQKGNVLSSSNVNTKILIQNLEFLRLLCEDHNPIFQTFLIRTDEYLALGENNSQQILLTLIFNLSKEIVKIFTHNKTQKHYIELLSNQEQFEDLIDLEEKLTEFRVEIIQGTTEKNLNYLGKNIDFQNYIDIYLKFLEELDEKDDSIARLNASFITFLNCFIEEKCVYPKPNLACITNKLNTKKLIINAEKAFDILMKQNGVFLRNEEQKDNRIEKFSEIMNNFYNYYEDITENPYFTISFYIFVILNQIADSNVKVNSVYKQVLAELSAQKGKESSKYASTINQEYYEFCSRLLMKNDVMYTVDFTKWKNQSEKYLLMFWSSDQYNNPFGKERFTKRIGYTIDGNKPKTSRITIHYLKQKDSLLIKEIDSAYFKKQADYSDHYTKLSGILNYYTQLSEKVGMRQKYYKEPLLLFLSEIKLDKLEIYNAFACFIPNFFLILASSGNFYEYFIFYWEILLLIILASIISNYMIFNAVKIKYIIKKEEKTYQDYIEPITNGEILPFLWTFIFGFLGLFYNFFYPFQLFTIFSISETMSSVLYSIQVRYKQFVSTAFLLVILIFFYAALTLYFFNVKDDMTMLCSSYLECFLYLFNYGLRAGGVPFEPKIIDQRGFWGEFVYSWVFYFLIILIILNIVNGIIVDTFQALREENNKINDERENICFICQIPRSIFESKGIDFEYHTSNEHNVYFYFCYLFKIKKRDVHDLNSVDFQVYNAIVDNKVEFFPLDKATGVSD